LFKKLPTITLKKLLKKLPTIFLQKTIQKLGYWKLQESSWIMFSDVVLLLATREPHWKTASIFQAWIMLYNATVCQCMLML